MWENNALGKSWQLFVICLQLKPVFSNFFGPFPTYHFQSHDVHMRDKI